MSLLNKVVTQGFIMVFSRLHPRQILCVLDAIDQQAPSYTLTRPQALRRVMWVLASVSVSLLFLHYAKYAQSFEWVLSLVAKAQDFAPQYYVERMTQRGNLEFWGYVWWSAMHLIAFIMLPFAVIVWGLKAPLGDYGWRWRATHKHWRGYALLLSPILVFVVIASTGQDFVNHYPFYSDAGRSLGDFLSWELLYMAQFICLEFFFRGYMLNALRPAMGANAIWVMCVPYMMIHLPKLWPEAFGAILFGLFLGILALRTRSIWGGVLVHAGVALSMDIAALLRKQGVLFLN
jgi:membrane protease YdiL (CAAX protease family)